MKPYIISPSERILETERFYLRRFILDDAPFLYHLNKNENVMRYTGDVPFKNIKATEEFVKNYTHYDDYNMGRWAICDKKQGEFMGWCGLKYHPEENIVDVGYRIIEKHWNKGIATEVTKTVLLYGFNSLHIQDIYAYVDIRNTASSKVAKKSGLKLVKEIIHHGNPTFLYHLKNNAIEVKEITASETYIIRQQVLRPTKTISDCHFDNDEDTNTFHLGLFYYGSLAGVVSYMNKNNSDFKATNPYQLRGMAMDVRFQGKKLGNVLLKKGEEILRQKKCDLLWCNARKKAVDFYMRFNFCTFGKPFQIPEIGEHIIMHKKIQP